MYYKLRPKVADPAFKTKSADSNYTVEQIEQSLHKCGEFDLNIVMVQVSLV